MCSGWKKNSSVWTMEGRLLVPLFCTGPKEVEDEGGGTQINGKMDWRLQESEYC